MKQESFAVLPVALSEEPVALFNDGSPVWPITSADLPYLTQLASLFNVELAFIERNHCTTVVPCEKTRTSVGCFNKKLLPLANLYADLTQRGCLLLADIDDLHSTPFSVVILDVDEVTFEIVEAICSSESRSSIGIIIGNGFDEIRRQVLLRSATTRLRVCAKPKRVEIVPTVPIALLTTDSRTLIGSAATPEEVRDAWTNGSDVLHLMTRSDGIDAFLMRDLLLCPMTPTLIEKRTSASPRCALTGFCHMENAPFHSVESSGRLIHPRAARALALVYNVCWGILPAGTWVDPIWSAGLYLATNPQVGAVITTWEITTTEDEDMASLLEDLVHGERLGSAVAKHNQTSEGGIIRGHRLILLGDPDMSLWPRNHAKAMVDA